MAGYAIVLKTISQELKLYWQLWKASASLTTRSRSNCRMRACRSLLTPSISCSRLSRASDRLSKRDRQHAPEQGKRRGAMHCAPTYLVFLYHSTDNITVNRRL